MQKVAELGGGNCPTFCRAKGNGVNVDCRAVQNVDIVADFEKPLPLQSGEFDLVYSQFVLEHISWRTVKQFIREICRVLKPEGKAVIVTANLYEQCKKAVSEAWTENTSCMIFGDLDYPENSHKNGFSPEYAVKLFREAGFREVKTAPLPWCSTDLVIEAIK